VGKKVSEIIGNTLPSTAILAFFAIVIAIVFGILFGIISALHKDTWIDRLIVW
jgi:peptide/nickel transport system permease protein